MTAGEDRPLGEDRQQITAFLEMMAAEAGAARNTLLAYSRDLAGASELLGGRLAAATAEELHRLGEAWLPLKRATVARRTSPTPRSLASLASTSRRPSKSTSSTESWP